MTPPPPSHPPDAAPEAALAVIALGSNLGDSVAVVRAAMDRLETFAAAPLRRSALWRTAPVDCPPGSPPFINAVVLFTPQAGETPESLLARLQALERDFGRRPDSRRNAPRPLDLDLIAFGAETRDTPALRLPHPHAWQRRFVLAPLAELAPGLQPPGWPAPVATLLAGLPQDASVRCWAAP